MKAAQISQALLERRRVACGKFVSYRFKDIKNKNGEQVAVVALYEVAMANNFGAAVQEFLPRDVKTADEAAKRVVVTFKEGDLVSFEYDELSKTAYDTESGHLFKLKQGTKVFPVE